MLANRSSAWRWRAISLASAVFLGAWGWNVLSQERSTADSPHRIPVALVDVAKVFKEAREFNQQMQKLKGEIEAVEQEVRARTKQMEASGAKETSATPAANSVAQAQAQAAKMLADAALLVKRQEFLQKEAAIYAESYGLVEKIVARIGKARDVGVVLRYSNDPINVGDRNSVLQGVNRPIVYSAVPDLTDEVIAALNEPKP